MMTTITNANLRSGTGKTYNKIGAAESDARTHLLRAGGNSYEVELHQREASRVSEKNPPTGAGLTARS